MHLFMQRNTQIYNWFFKLLTPTQALIALIERELIFLAVTTLYSFSAVHLHYHLNLFICINSFYFIKLVEHPKYYVLNLVCNSIKVMLDALFID